MQDAKKQLRWHLVQRLCQKDVTYTELQDALSSQLASQHAAFDQVHTLDCLAHSPQCAILCVQPCVIPKRAVVNEHSLCTLPG